MSLLLGKRFSVVVVKVVASYEATGSYILQCVVCSEIRV